MREFGSDFHYMGNLPRSGANPFRRRDAVWYASGRQAFSEAAAHNGWRRIWMPAYICGSLAEAVAHTGIETVYYPDSPVENDVKAISRIPFREGDALLRVNYFGLRGWRDNSSLPVDIIEDHSHDPAGPWASGSNADWCFASLRKSLPVADGGVLWSPMRRRLPVQPVQSRVVADLTERRLVAMKIKSAYLSGGHADKEAFRKIFADTENLFACLPPCVPSEESLSLCKSIDMEAWSGRKTENWMYLNKQFSTRTIGILQPESGCRPFSFAVRFGSHAEREAVRRELIKEGVYPAILWPVAEGGGGKASELSGTLLSLHCDARYSPRDMEIMGGLIEKALAATTGDGL